MWCGELGLGLVIVGPLVSGEYREMLGWNQIAFRDNLFRVVYLIIAGTAQQSLYICHLDRRLVDCRLAKNALKHAVHLSPTNTR